MDGVMMVVPDLIQHQKPAAAVEVLVLVDPLVVLREEALVEMD